MSTLDVPTKPGRRGAAIAAVVAAAVAVAGTVMLSPGNSAYSVWLTLENASQLIEGDDVVAGGARIGSVDTIRLAGDRRVELKLTIDNPLYRPLHQGSRAVVRMRSLSGVASRYVELRSAGVAEQGAQIPDGGRIGVDKTTSTVEFDQLFATFDRPTRAALRGVINGLANQYRGRSAAARRGWLYLNPALIASARLFRELNRDTPSLRAFASSSSRLVTDLAARRSDLTALVEHLATAMEAIGRRKQALARAISGFPPFLRQANTTFVGLRGALDDARPLVREAGPVASKLQAFMAKLRPLAIDAIPTMRSLSTLLRRPGATNDLVELTRSAVPLRQIGVGPVSRDGRSRPGALPVSTRALKHSVPEVAYLRPWGVDLAGLLDYLGHGSPSDALRGLVRTALQVDVADLVQGHVGLRQETVDANGQTLILNQRNRCPLSMERGTAWKPTPDYPCDPSQVPPGR